MKMTVTPGRPFAIGSWNGKEWHLVKTFEKPGNSISDVKLYIVGRKASEVEDWALFVDEFYGNYQYIAPIGVIFTNWIEDDFEERG